MFNTHIESALRSRSGEDSLDSGGRLPLLLRYRRRLKSLWLLHDGTPVRLRLARNLSSAEARTGETVDLEVVEDSRWATPS